MINSGRLFSVAIADCWDIMRVTMIYTLLSRKCRDSSRTRRTIFFRIYGHVYIFLDDENARLCSHPNEVHVDQDWNPIATLKPRLAKRFLLIHYRRDFHCKVIYNIYFYIFFSMIKTTEWKLWIGCYARWNHMVAIVLDGLSAWKHQMRG